MAGTFGYELDPKKLTEEEREEIKKQVLQYKRYAELIQGGTYYRLSNPLEDVYAAWMFVSKSGDRALLNVVILEIHGNMAVNYVKLRGLKKDAVYEDAATGKCYYGSALMEAGIPMPVRQEEYPAYQMELTEKRHRGG